jgi:hypothetical protein
MLTVFLVMRSTPQRNPLYSESLSRVRSQELAKRARGEVRPEGYVMCPALSLSPEVRMPKNKTRELVLPDLFPSTFNLYP